MKNVYLNRRRKQVPRLYALKDFSQADLEIYRMMTFDGFTREQVVKKLMVEEMGKYPLEYIQTLGQILKTI